MSFLETVTRSNLIRFCHKVLEQGHLSPDVAQAHSDHMVDLLLRPNLFSHFCSPTDYSALTDALERIGQGGGAPLEASWFSRITSNLPDMITAQKPEAFANVVDALFHCENLDLYAHSCTSTATRAMLNKSVRNAARAVDAITSPKMADDDTLVIDASLEFDKLSTYALFIRATDDPTTQRLLLRYLERTAHRLTYHPDTVQPQIIIDTLDTVTDVLQGVPLGTYSEIERAHFAHTLTNNISWAVKNYNSDIRPYLDEVGDSVVGLVKMAPQHMLLRGDLTALVHEMDKDDTHDYTFSQRLQLATFAGRGAVSDVFNKAKERLAAAETFDDVDAMIGYSMDSLVALRHPAHADLKVAYCDKLVALCEPLVGSPDVVTVGRAAQQVIQAIEPAYAMREGETHINVATQRLQEGQAPHEVFAMRASLLGHPHLAIQIRDHGQARRAAAKMTLPLKGL